MRYNPLEARTLFIDGPVAVYISTASREEIEAAYWRIANYVKVAAIELDKEHGKRILEVGNDPARTQR